VVECKPLLRGRRRGLLPDRPPAALRRARGRPGHRDRRGGYRHGKAVQVDPINPTLKAPGSKRLRLKSDGLPSTVAFTFNLRRYIMAWIRLDVDSVRAHLVATAAAAAAETDPDIVAEAVAAAEAEMDASMTSVGSWNLVSITAGNMTINANPPVADDGEIVTGQAGGNLHSSVLGALRLFGGLGGPGGYNSVSGAIDQLWAGAYTRPSFGSTASCGIWGAFRNCLGVILGLFWGCKGV